MEHESRIECSNVSVEKQPDGSFDWSGADRRCISMSFEFKIAGATVKICKCEKCSYFDREYAKTDMQYVCTKCKFKKIN
jgi:hypothetical protein